MHRRDDKAGQALPVLRDCRDRIMELVAAAARGGDLSAVRDLAALAEEVDRIVLRLQAGTATPADMPQKRAQPVEKSPSPSRRHAAAQVEAKATGYFRSARDLVRRGRSRKSGDSYEHRVSREALDRIVGELASWRPRQPPITADTLGGQGNGESAVPSYQVYAALGWLRELGLVERHGRSGYSVRSPERLGAAVEEAFEALPAESGRD